VLQKLAEEVLKTLKNIQMPKKPMKVYFVEEVTPLGR
jgi:hypothetical protein